MLFSKVVLPTCRGPVRRITGNVRLASIKGVLSVLDSMIKVVSSIMEFVSIIDDFTGRIKVKRGATILTFPRFFVFHEAGIPMNQIVVPLEDCSDISSGSGKYGRQLNFTHCF